ncbi:MAG: tRNA (adenosine(37)-N6)-threonylcarbamoyltransferase complex dimerization subunit type 1 TsaB [Chloroflexi bacterium]|nr:tRNA (adenosine(37)-N6)-threonylcarbamoyltransferase complex dimerization subunit type 1 TsaB [Chloroflexota bacterium]
MLLALDTSTAQTGLALYDGLQILAETTWTTQQRHTAELAPAVAALLKRGGVSMETVEALGVAIGPGSFTSLRVGLAFAKGIALARRLPLVGVFTLDVIAAAQPPDTRPLAAVLQAGRRRIAVGWYLHSENGWQAQGEAKVTTVEELAEQIERPTLIAGELTAEDRSRLGRKRANVFLAPPVRCIRRPSILADLAWTRWKKNETDNPAALAPLYLRVEGAPNS